MTRAGRDPNHHPAWWVDLRPPRVRRPAWRCALLPFEVFLVHVVFGLIGLARYRMPVLLSGTVAVIMFGFAVASVIDISS